MFNSKKNFTFQRFNVTMPIVLSVILLIFKSIFLLGVEVSSTLESINPQEQEQISSAISDSQFHPILLERASVELLLIEENQEKEEKSESENLPLHQFVETAIFSVSKKDFTVWQITFFSSKGKQEGVLLYDLFGCWKSELV